MPPSQFPPKRSNRFALALALGLALLTGFVVGRIETLRSPSATLPSAAISDTELLAQGYYDALNTYFATGNDGNLRDVIAPGLQNHAPPPGVGDDLNGFLQHLGVIRSRYPGLQLKVVDLETAETQAIAHIQPDAAGEPAVVDSVFGGEAIWPGLEVLQIRNDQVTARWTDQAVDRLLDPFAGHTLTLEESAWYSSVLERWTYHPRSSERWRGIFPPLVLIAESAGLAISFGTTTDAEPVLYRKQERDSVAVTATESIELSMSDVVVIPPDTPFEVINGSSDPATVIAYYLFAPQTPLMTGSRIFAPYTVGVDRELLANGAPLQVRSGSAQFEVGLATFRTGQEFGTDMTLGAWALVVLQGELEIDAPANTLWSLEWPERGPPLPSHLTIPARSAVIVHPGSEITAHSRGDPDTQLLYVLITPVSS